jgi:acetyl esterase/lipase
MLLLPLGVGAPEISPYLAIANAVILVVSIANPRRRGKRGRHHRLQSLAIIASLAGLLLSAMPLVQVPATEQQFAEVMQNRLGADYLAQVPDQVKRQMRSRPFVLADVFRPMALGESRYTADIPFATADGIVLKMNVYRPPQIGKYPAIVSIYGGAWQRGSPLENAKFNRYMAAQGYTVLAIDYRHAPDYHFPAQINDVRAALSFIRQHAAEYEVDLERVAVIGRSAGSQLAMLAAYSPEIAFPIRAVVSYYGPIDLTAGYRNPPIPDPINSRAVLKAFLGGTPSQLPELYRDASPITYVKPDLPPTLLIYGDRDYIVQAKYGQKMAERLQEAGNTVVFLKIPWANHAFDAIFNGLSNQIALYYTERFLAWALR